MEGTKNITLQKASFIEPWRERETSHLMMVLRTSVDTRVSIQAERWLGLLCIVEHASVKPAIASTQPNILHCKYIAASHAVFDMEQAVAQKPWILMCSFFTTPAWVDTGIHILEIFIHICRMRKGQENDAYLDKEVWDVLPLITLELNDLYCRKRALIKITRLQKSIQNK
jgi:hypothetical protein